MDILEFPRFLESKRVKNPHVLGDTVVLHDFQLRHANFPTSASSIPRSVIKFICIKKFWNSTLSDNILYNCGSEIKKIVKHNPRHLLAEYLYYLVYSIDKCRV
ncbi:hypothetical protein RF11_13770 [Thelohanellus kitauei]|uniref:Uncharacterized protein n=1 Tax=Thelohanellus kitauei TaxID=669202 RepID=A0A0C2IMI6_THEKT|nr:hypothetical protein RF11_13770 [Thelohanellus kitauei]